MLRRSALALMAAGLLSLAGCRREPVPALEGRDLIAAIKRRETAVLGMQRAIENQGPDLKVKFIPPLLGLLIPFLCQMLVKCLLPQVLKQHRAIDRSPAGPIATRWKARVGEEFLRKYTGSVGSSDVARHVEGAFEAFRKASEQELTETVIALQAVPTDADWDAAGLARDLAREE